MTELEHMLARLATWPYKRSLIWRGWEFCQDGSRKTLAVARSIASGRIEYRVTDITCESHEEWCGILQQWLQDFSWSALLQAYAAASPGRSGVPSPRDRVMPRDGVPVEIHQIEDPDAYVQALIAFRRGELC